jgi:hypothetical protein
LYALAASGRNAAMIVGRNIDFFMAIPRLAAFETYSKRNLICGMAICSVFDLWQGISRKTWLDSFASKEGI